MTRRPRTVVAVTVVACVAMLSAQTGSPNLRNAQDWVVQQATSWGLANAHTESWDFAHDGWSNERVPVHVVSPVKDYLVAEALAWTPGPSTLASRAISTSTRAQDAHAA